MARRITMSQFRSKLREAERKQKQAIQKVSRAIDSYNRELRAHNARVQTNRKRLLSELARLSRQSGSPNFAVYRRSVRSLHETYERLEERAESYQLNARFDRLIDLSERETANSVEVANQLLNPEHHANQEDYLSEDVELIGRLQRFQVDLEDRWRGAVFSLNPRNPDAARHFCTSAREIFVSILDMKAPDAEVLKILPNCERVQDTNKPARREKIRYLLAVQGLNDAILEDFVDQDMQNIVELFRVFNDGTHGSAGKFGLPQLAAIKKRVEHGIFYLTEIAGVN